MPLGNDDEQDLIADLNPADDSIEVRNGSDRYPIDFHDDVALP